MNSLYYEGMNESGHKISGHYSGSKEDLLRELQATNVTLTRLKEEQEKLKEGRFRLADLHGAIEQLHYLLVAGLQINQALGLLIKGTRKKSVRSFWTEVRENLRGGTPLSQSMKLTLEHQECPMDEFYINVIAVGEEVGDLNSALQRVREYLDFKMTLAKEIRSALSYPAFLFSAGLVTMLLVVGLILPRFAAIYSPEEIARLPGVSQLTLSLGSQINNQPYLVLAGVIGAVIACLWVVGSQPLRKAVGKFLVRLPLLNSAVLHLELARLFTSLGTMLGSGVDLTRAIRLSATVVGGAGLRNLLEETEFDLRKGKKLSESWRKHSLIPDDIVSLVTVGETSACLDDIFTRAGKKYMELFKSKVSSLLTFLEPAIILLLGVFIGFIVVSIMLAVVSMSDVYG